MDFSDFVDQCNAEDALATESSREGPTLPDLVDRVLSSLDLPPFEPDAQCDGRDEGSISTTTKREIVHALDISDRILFPKP